MSYFLWSSTPDAPLLRLAAQGKLRDDLKNTFDRMLKDPKSERFIENFVGQWLQTRDVENKFFDTPQILGIDDGNKARQIFNLYTRQDMKKETELFFSHILNENRPAIELITADYSFINDRLAKFYGINEFKSNEFQKVSFKGNSRNGQRSLIRLEPHPSNFKNSGAPPNGNMIGEGATILSGGMNGQMMSKVKYQAFW